MIYLYDFAVNPFAQVPRLSSSKENRTRKGMIVIEANYRTGLATGLFLPVFAGKPPKIQKDR